MASVWLAFETPIATPSPQPTRIALKASDRHGFLDGGQPADMI
jgi:hypothetical protein